VYRRKNHCYVGDAQRVAVERDEHRIAHTQCYILTPAVTFPPEKDDDFGINKKKCFALRDVAKAAGEHQDKPLLFF
jgi:hypothetical protein